MLSSFNPYVSNAIPTEHDEQVLFIKWWRLLHPDVRIFAVPNGGHRSKVGAARLKAEGVSPGVPDLFIPALKLWLEMKRKKGGAVSTDQQGWANYLNGCGYTTMLCRGFDDARIQVTEFLEKQTA